MSSEKKSLRIPADDYESLDDMSTDLGLSEHRAAIKALQRGLAEYGYGAFAIDDDGDDTRWLATLFGEIAKALAVAGVAFVMTTFVQEPVVLWYAAASLGMAVLFLLGERRADLVGRLLGMPENAPWAKGSEVDE